MARPVIITGGGTGGHIFPMQAIAEALRARGLSSEEIVYVGSRRGKERTLLAGDASELITLPGRGIRRSLSPRALLQNVGAVCGLVAAQCLAVILVARRRPRAVVSVGGYASSAVSLASVLWRRPLVLVAFDATEGAAHRVVSRFAARRCVAFPSSDPRDVVTGAPLRANVASVTRTSVKTFDPSRPKWTVVVMTGSLGAASVNRATLELAHAWREREDIRLVHVTGDRDYAWVRAQADEGGPYVLDYRIEAFGDMATLWSQCDVAICRAGAMTVAELTYLAIPSILVPLPHAPGDHQTKNARVLVDHGAALMVSDAGVSGSRLADAVESLVAHPDDLVSMGRAAGTLGRPNAAASIADVVLEVCR